MNEATLKQKIKNCKNFEYGISTFCLNKNQLSSKLGIITQQFYTCLEQPRYLRLHPLPESWQWQQQRQQLQLWASYWMHLLAPEKTQPHFHIINKAHSSLSSNLTNDSPASKTRNGLQMTSPKYMLKHLLHANTLQLWFMWSYYTLFWNNVLLLLWWWWWCGGGCKPYCICRKIKTYYTFKHGKNT